MEVEVELSNTLPYRMLTPPSTEGVSTPRAQLSPTSSEPEWPQANSSPGTQLCLLIHGPPSNLTSGRGKVRSVPLPPWSSGVTGVSAAPGRPRSLSLVGLGICEDARGHAIWPPPEPPRQVLPFQLPGATCPTSPLEDRKVPTQGGPRGLLGGG